jgi:hypothetical protein
MFLIAERYRGIVTEVSIVEPGKYETDIVRPYGFVREFHKRLYVWHQIKILRLVVQSD